MTPTTASTLPTTGPDPASLNRLHDLVVPAHVPFWPPAPGWYWLGTFVSVALIWAVLRFAVAWQRNRYRREALAIWQTQCDLLADASSRAIALAELAVLLKRTALSAYARTDIAALTGDTWLAFLDRSANTSVFSSPTGRLLEAAAYGLSSPDHTDEQQARQAADLVRLWIVRHQISVDGGPAR